MKKETTQILVTGSNGQVGQELQKLAPDFPDFQFTFVDVDELDITDVKATEHFFEHKKFDYCLNCAAYTAVDRAEAEEEIAWKVNAKGVRHLTDALAKTGGKILQLSTDYVYHIAQNTPFREDDPTNPQGIYARTKLEGDKIALSRGGMVIRTSWVYSSFGNNFVKTMLRLGREREELGVVFDQIGTPTYARDLVQAMLQILQKIENEEVGTERFNEVYHFSNEGVTSWYDFAQAILSTKNIEVKLRPIETKDYPTPAKRPYFSLLNKAKIKSTFGLEIPHWQVSLNACLSLL